jgi:hypothetical protein
MTHHRGPAPKTCGRRHPRRHLPLFARLRRGWIRNPTWGQTLGPETSWLQLQERVDYLGIELTAQFADPNEVLASGHGIP